MPCYHPIPAAVLHKVNPETGKNLISFRKDIPLSSIKQAIKVPCGRCCGCRLESSRQWAVRCIHEAELHTKNCFITLTYNEEHLPADRSVHVEDFQKFMKRLRKYFGSESVRFFHCGEYGTKGNRPHYHAILFGLDFDDKIPLSDNIGPNTLYISSTLERLWPFGFSTIGAVTFDSAAYVARYVMKKVNGEQAKEHYQGRHPEYITMSRRPGIAKGWFDKFYKDVYSYDHIILKDKVPCKPPRYYDNLYDVFAHEDMERIKNERMEKAKSRPDYNDVERLAMKEKFKIVSLKRFKRRFEEQ